MASVKGEGFERRVVMLKGQREGGVVGPGWSRVKMKS